MNRPGTYGFRFAAEYFSVGDITFLGDRRRNIEDIPPSLVSLESGEYTILAASLNSGVELGGCVYNVS